MGGGYGSTVASVKESSLAALPESPWLRTDGFAKGSSIAALARLSNKLARGGLIELLRMLWRRSEALSVAAWAGGMIYPSPLLRRARCSLFLSHRGFVPTALPRVPRSLLQTACSIACEVRFDFVARLSTAAIPDPLADCSVGTATWADHMQLQPRPATPVELRCHRIDGSSGSAQ